MADGAAVTGKRTVQLLGAWIVFEDEAGQDLKPGKGRTWSRRGRTPMVKVVGKGSGWVLMAGMICVRPGHETRLIYRTQTYRGRTGEKKGFRAREFADLLTSACRQLGDVPADRGVGQRQYPSRQVLVGVLRARLRLADHRQAPALRARPQPRRDVVFSVQVLWDSVGMRFMFLPRCLFVGARSNGGGCGGPRGAGAVRVAVPLRPGRL